MQGQQFNMSEAVIAEYKAMVSDLMHELVMVKAMNKRLQTELNMERQRNIELDKNKK